MSEKQKKLIQKIVIVVCVVGVLICAIWLIISGISNSRTEKELDALKQEYVSVEPLATSTPQPQSSVQQPESTEAPTVTPEPDKVIIDGMEYLTFDGLEVPKLTIDFEGLHEENEHIYAWIYIPNTNVDYPIVQHPSDPSYYLRRNTKGKSATAGCIFTEHYNNKDFNDNLTVIYGHNMRNESMFAHLHYFEDADFLAENPYVYIYTEQDVRVYQIFAAHEYSDMHLLLNSDTADDEVFGQYLENLKTLNGAKDNFNWEIGVSSEDKVICLSTCVRNEDEKRYLVQAKLIAVEEMP
ncbi:MAG: class B sortase [Lachnospiraceae bacterium]|nr:class B sortase [Lachnospiraceae bacterium]MBQ7777162.1 class B sortase [Lachnospiraceae bacterium]